MSNFIRRLYYWFAYKCNGNEHSRAEVRWAITQRSLLLYPLNKRIYWSMLAYKYGCSLKAIATAQQLTRERVRQHIRKGVRLAWEAQKRK